MKQRSIFLTILLWCELIISARLLMFTLPVLISNFAKGRFYLVSLADWTIFTLTLIAFFYFLTGLASLSGFRGWKLFHYLGVVLTAVLSFSLINKILSVYSIVSYGYYIPVVVSVFLACAVTFHKNAHGQPAH